MGFFGKIFNTNENRAKVHIEVDDITRSYFGGDVLRGQVKKYPLYRFFTPPPTESFFTNTITG